MTQLINYDNAGKVMVYHTVPNKAGTPDFEHKAMVSLSAAVPAKDYAGSDNPDLLVVKCAVPGCDTTVYVPLAGDGEAQEFHARVRHAKGQFLTLSEARDYVVARVTQQGQEARIDQNGPLGRP